MKTFNHVLVFHILVNIAIIAKVQMTIKNTCDTETVF